MARKKKSTPPPGQLSLEGIPGFWTNEVGQYTQTNCPEPNKPLVCSEKIDTEYHVERKNSLSVESDFNVLQPHQVTVYVGITFNACQGIREAKQGWKKNPVPSEVVFDCRPLELASKYATELRLEELYAPDETYVLGRGGLVNIAVFIDILRCYGTLAKWSQEVCKETGTKPMIDFKPIQPAPDTPVGKLWNVLGMSNLMTRNPSNIWNSGITEFQSRIVTPLLMVNIKNRNEVLTNVQDWFDYISSRIGNQTRYRLITVVHEVVKNLVEHGHRGTFGVSVWPSGHIEILWSNPIDHLVDWWPPEDTAKGLAESLLNSSGGGMPYIYEDLLPLYKGVLIINWKTHNLIFRPAGRKVCESHEFYSKRAINFSLIGLKSRSDTFLPRSILFHLHLFCKDTKNKS